MNTRSTQSGAAWLPIIIVLAIIVIGVGIYMYGQPASTVDETPETATTTADVTTDQGANVSDSVSADGAASTTDAVAN